MYTLIILVILGSGGTSSAMEKQEGFKTLSLCEKAGEKLVNDLHFRNDKSPVQYSCIQVKDK